MKLRSRRKQPNVEQGLASVAFSENVEHTQASMDDMEEDHYEGDDIFYDDFDIEGAEEYRYEVAGEEILMEEDETQFEDYDFKDYDELLQNTDEPYSDFGEEDQVELIAQKELPTTNPFVG